MHMTRSIVLPAAALALAIGSAYAAGDDKSRDVPGFNQMDKNSDGALTRSEASGNPKLLAHFDTVDDNGDGRLSRGEYLEIMARQDLHNLRENLAEFINPEGKPPLTVAKQGQSASGQSGGTQAAQTLPMPTSSQLVRDVQTSLEGKGIDAGPVDGIWGPRTHQALRQFQEQQGLERTGRLDARTLAALDIPGEQTASAGASASAGGTTSFQQADKDNNGFVSREEFNSTFAANRTAGR